MARTLIRTDVLDWLRANQWQAQNGYLPKYHGMRFPTRCAIIGGNKMPSRATNTEGVGQHCEGVSTMLQHTTELPSRETLYSLYVEQQISALDIARRFNVCRRTVRKWLIGAGIELRTNSDAQKAHHKIDEGRIYRLYVVEGLSQSRVAEILGLTQSGVGKILRRNGWPTRGKSNHGSANGMYGRTHTPEARIKIKKANERQFSSAEARHRHGVLTAQTIRDGKHRIKETRIEAAVSRVLSSLNVSFEKQFVISNFAFDFRVDDLLIECDGTFWHADPRFYDHNNLKPVQRRNIWNDRRKNECAKANGFRLLRLWEHDINTDTDMVVGVIAQEIKCQQN